jgi:hypothetical protein
MTWTVIERTRVDGNILKGGIATSSNFKDLYTAEDVKAAILNNTWVSHSGYNHWKPGTPPHNKEQVKFVEITDVSFCEFAGVDFTAIIDDESITGRSWLYTEMPEVIEREGITAVQVSDDKCEFSVDISQVPKNAVFEVRAICYLAPGLGKSPHLASVRSGKVTFNVYGNIAEISGNTLKITLPEQLPGYRNAYSTLYSKEQDYD